MDDIVYNSTIYSTQIIETKENDKKNKKTTNRYMQSVEKTTKTRFLHEITVNRVKPT